MHLIPTILTLIVLCGVGILANAKIARRAVAMGLCPMCSGEGREFVQMNGLGGCLECVDGTLASHRAKARAQGRKAWA